MLLSEHIAECQEILDREGDLPVFHDNTQPCGCGMNLGSDDEEPEVEVHEAEEYWYRRVRHDMPKRAVIANGH